ncbi:MAG: hypothetical protein JO057_10835, partial [Chloroflexi bacterium]|nr:hypothetical protein [Chloroflexota bacterium]
MHNLTYTCVLTDDIDRLDAFYRAVLQLEPDSRGAYRQFPTQPGVFSLWSLAEFRQIVGQDAMAAHGGVMLEFHVDDADAEYARLQHLPNVTVEFVLTPT